MSSLVRSIRRVTSPVTGIKRGNYVSSKLGCLVYSCSKWWEQIAGEEAAKATTTFRLELVDTKPLEEVFRARQRHLWFWILQCYSRDRYSFVGVSTYGKVINSEAEWLRHGLVLFFCLFIYLKDYAAKPWLAMQKEETWWKARFLFLFEGRIKEKDCKWKAGGEAVERSQHERMECKWQTWDTLKCSCRDEFSRGREREDSEDGNGNWAMVLE